MRKAHLLAKRTDDDVKGTEQPFPDSWLATTAPIALGFLTDIASEFVVYRERAGREKLWPLIANQYKLWCVGRGGDESVSWSLCEALVRVACRELFRLQRRVFVGAEFRELANIDLHNWATLMLSFFSALLAQSVDIEIDARNNLLELKEKASFDRKERDDDADLDFEVVQTPFGRGRLVNRRRKDYYPGFDIAVNVVELDFGAVLYQPLPNVNATTGNGNGSRITSEVDGKCRIALESLGCLFFHH